MTPQVPPYRRGEGFGSLGVRFKEVVEPERASLSPETPGAWISIALAVVAAAAGIAWLIRRHRRRRYRRDAEKELRALRTLWEGDGGKLEALEGVSPLLKRCALGGFARPKVAPLAGERWVAFLTASGKEPFGEAAGRALLAVSTRGASAVSASDAASLFGAASTWIRGHRADV